MRWPANTAPPRRYSWHRWLAWYPIRFGDNHVWLEIVQRRYVQHSNSCDRWEVVEYREDLPESRIGEKELFALTRATGVGTLIFLGGLLWIGIYIAVMTSLDR